MRYLTAFLAAIPLLSTSSSSAYLFDTTTACAILMPPAFLAHADQEDVLVTLPGVARDLVYDAERQLIYISVPETDTVVYLSTVTFEIVDQVIFDNQPRGIDLSHDHSKLFVALYQAGAVAVLDLETQEVSTIFLTDLLGDPRTNDVVEAKANELFVSADPGSTGVAWIVKVNLDEDGTPIAAQRVASNRIIRSNPIFEVSPDEQFLYIGEGFSPNSLYKLDLNQDDAPIILEDDHGSISGTSHLELNPDGSRIYLTSGQVLDTATIEQDGSVGPGIHQFGDGPDVVFIADEPNLIKVYDTETQVQIDQIELNCDFDFIRKLLILPGDVGKLVLGDDVLCGLAQFGPPDCVDDDADCNDLLFCNGEETCVGGACVAGRDPCPGLLCNEELDLCAECLIDLDCDDSLFCNGVETCNAIGACEAGADPCPMPFCDEANNVCVGDTEEDVLVTLPGVARDLVYDAERQLIYISVPETNTVVYLSTVTFEIVDQVIFGNQPRGIDLSHDHSKLFVALNEGFGVAVLDLETQEVSTIFLTDLLGDPRTNDVVEARANELFVSADPSSTGFAWIVKVNLDEDGTPIAAQRVASNRIIRSNPIFEVSPDEQFLYIGEGGGPNSLYKLDLNQDDAPIILQNDHGSVSGTSHLELNSDGSRIYLTSGQVLDTATFEQDGSVGPGTHQFGDSPDVVFIADEPNLIKAYDAETQVQIDQIELNCDFDLIRKLLILPGDVGKLVLGDDVLCGLAQFGPPDCVDDDGDGKVTICHMPPGNPDNARTIIVRVSAAPAHLAHGDHCGPCEEDDGNLMGNDGDAAEDLCPADLDGSGDVGVADLAEFLGAWGPNLGHPAELDGDGAVSPADLAILLQSWGPCP